WLNIEVEVEAVDGADVRMVEEKTAERLVEGPLGNRRGGRRPEQRGAAIVEAGAAAGLALGYAVDRVIAAACPRPEIRADGAIGRGVLPFRRYVDGQD